MRIQYDCTELRRQKSKIVESTEVESSDTVRCESYLWLIEIQILV